MSPLANIEKHWINQRAFNVLFSNACPHFVKSLFAGFKNSMILLMKAKLDSFVVTNHFTQFCPRRQKSKLYNERPSVYHHVVRNHL